jgi:FtsP/CotA-like multicopper oxidase with cupredoxin domain
LIPLTQVVDLSTNIQRLKGESKMKKTKITMTRRQVLKTGLCAGAGMMLPWAFNRKAYAEALSYGLSDPALQPKFVEFAPNALDPGFLFKDLNQDGWPSHKPNFSIRVKQAIQETGLVNPRNGRKLKTRIWGYGNDNVTWPGQTIQVMTPSAGGTDETVIRWTNELQGKKHLLPVDTNLHWCYSLKGMSSANGVDYTQYSIKKNGVPIITHVHGGHTDYQFDGNPEFFFSPDGNVKGPQWDFVPGGYTNNFRYDNNVQAGNLWYHDHALGITRLNVYAGLAGFYFVRDEFDTGKPGNPLDLPAFPYELAYAIQDRMFLADGALFYPAYPGDPFYDDFIYDEEANLPEELFPGGGPTGLAEFFGDHMVVNGKIWPKADVEPRNYRLRLLNGTDSRFIVVQFRAVPLGSTDLSNAGEPLDFYVIGSDQGLASEAKQTNTLVFEPGSRYDIVFNFAELEYKRIVMSNIGGDAPFGGDFGDALDSDDFFPDRQTDRIMAFDVVVPKSSVLDSFDPGKIENTNVAVPPATIKRKVALFEGKDEFGRLQPLLGAEINGEWKALPWHEPTTETPTLNTTEEWEIYNFTGDAHPVHLHLVHFEILGRNVITFDSDDGDPGQEVKQHNGEFGVAPSVTNVIVGAPVTLGPSDGYVENAPKDMVTALPEQVTRIRATFDKEGRYVWHCHILSHEDHEMMRVLQVVPS